MKLIEIKISEFATLTGYIHEPNPEFSHIKSYPAILVLPGGGFRFCSAREAEPIAAAYYAKGYQAFVLDYTTVTKKPDAVMADPMNDVQLALGLIRDNANEYYINPSKVAMIGFSGGSHLASASATHGPIRPNVLLLGYPGIIHSDLRALDCPDIVESIDKNTPPTFLFVTRNDPVTPPRHALAYVMAMDQCGNDYELHIFKDGTHGLSLATPFTSHGDSANVNPRFSQWFELSVQWLTQQLGDFTIYD